MLQPVDLVEFRPNIPKLSADISLPLGDAIDLVADILIPGLSAPINALRSFKLPGMPPPKLEAPISLDAGISLDSRISIGLVTAGIIDWVRKGAKLDLAGAASLLDGLYLSDNVVDGVDLPELSGAFNLDLLVKLLIGGKDYGLLIGAQSSFGLDGGYELDLEDGGEPLGQGDGKVRPSEMLAGLLGSGDDGRLDFKDVVESLMPGGGLYDFDVYGDAKVSLAGQLNLDLANSVLRKNISRLTDLLTFLPGAGITGTLGTIATDAIAVIPKVDLELSSTNSFKIFDTREGQPVLFA